MWTWRTLHFSRLAMLSTFAFAFATSSLSQRRPRAIDAIKVARVSDRVGRAWCGGSEIGRSISRRRVTAVLRHGTSRVSAPCARRRPDFSIWASWTTGRATNRYQCRLRQSHSALSELWSLSSCLGLGF